MALNPDKARRNGINTVCYHFDCVLNRLNDHGLVLIDRFIDAENQIDAHLREKFMVGIEGLPFTRQMRLDRVVGFHYSAIGQSHFPSLIDVALGSLRFAINAHTRRQAQHHATARELIDLLNPMFWRNAGGGPVPELGFLFSPKTIRADRYRERYQSLKDFLAANGVYTEQRITNQRNF